MTALKTMKPLVSRTISVTEIPRGAQEVWARDMGMYPQLIEKIRALRKGLAEEVEFESERQARNVCAKVRQYARKKGLHVSIRRREAVCYFSKADPAARG